LHTQPPPFKCRGPIAEAPLSAASRQHTSAAKNSEHHLAGWKEMTAGKELSLEKELFELSTAKLTKNLAIFIIMSPKFTPQPF